MTGPKCGDPLCHCAHAPDPTLLVPDELRNVSLLPGGRPSLASLVSLVDVAEVEREMMRAEWTRIREFIEPTPTRKQRLLRAIAGALRRIAAWVES